MKYGPAARMAATSIAAGLARHRHLHETQINQVCADMMFDAATLQFHGIDCKLVSNGGLPTYVRPNPGH